MARVEVCAQEDCRPGREATLRVYLNGRLVGASQGTPEDLADFGAGYLLSEGWISDRDRLGPIEVDGIARAVRLSTTEAIPEELVLRWRTSSASLAATLPLNASSVLRPANTSAKDDPVRFDANDIAAQMKRLEEASPKRGSGECVHCCGAGAQRSQELLFVREDLGRHNAMDKLIGHAWLEEMPLDNCALFITGRISAEMAFKALRAKAPVLVSLKSATSEAVDLANREGLTIISHCRDDSMLIHSHPERIIST